MQDREKTYIEYQYGDTHKVVQAARIVYAEAHSKAVIFHFMNEKKQMDTARVNHVSLLQLLSYHPGSFVMVNRHFIVRRRFLLGIVDRQGSPGDYDCTVRFVDKPLAISRRRVPIVQDALHKKV